MRHSAAHVLAKAVQRLYPGSKLGIGPVIENGFYYDIDIPTKLERRRPAAHRGRDARDRRRRRAVRRARSGPGSRRSSTTPPRDDNPYKREIVEGLGDDEPISFYRTGADWVDLCRGPHVGGLERDRRVQAD